jgi:hypothetical protein
MDGYIAYRAVRRLSDLSKEWRNVTVLLALALFIVGMAVSWNILSDEVKRLSLGPLLFVLMFLAPVALGLHSSQLVICARMGKNNLPFSQALLSTALGRVINILPLPAGFAVRWAALVSVGVTGYASATLLLFSHIVWFGLALTLSGLVLVSEHAGTSLPFVVGISVVAACLGWLWHRRMLWLGLLLMFNRCLLLLAFSAQLYLIFHALGACVNLLNSAYYALANVVGSIVPFVPSGLGISEASGALLARLIGEPAALVFVAIGINRLIGLALCGLVALIGLSHRTPRQGESRSEQS